MKKTLLLTLFLAATLLLSCTNELSEQELTRKIVDANTNLNTYTIAMDINTTIETTLREKPTTMRTDMQLSGAMDRVKKQMQTKGTVKSQMLGFKTEADLETYLVGDYTYTKIMDTWMKTKVDKNVWEQQDQVQQYITLLKSGTIERQEDEKIDGNDYYVVLIKPDIKTLVEQALKQNGQEESPMQDMDFADIMRSYTSTLWINKKSFVIDRTVADMELVMTPENMGKNATNITLKMDMHMAFAISNINEPVTIILPPEAGSAKEIEKKENSITGNAIAEALG
jgi:hypothetical protein